MKKSWRSQTDLHLMVSTSISGRYVVVALDGDRYHLLAHDARALAQALLEVAEDAERVSSASLPAAPPSAPSSSGDRNGGEGR